MRTLDNKMIIYDDTCPMCSLYTGGFIRFGFLSANGRMPFSKLTDKRILRNIDLSRATQEIPLVDMENGNTLYGIDSLVYILKQRFPFIAWMMNIAPVDRFFRRLYKMVSFNRRVIIPARPSNQGVDCTPPFNRKYRIVFIVFAVLISSLITYLFGRSVAPYIAIDQMSGGWQMMLVAGTGWIVQIMAALLLMKRNMLEYLGHLSTVMILGVLILLPGIVFSSLTDYEYWLIPVISVVISSGIMLWQHIKRVKHINASQVWTLSWFLALQVTAWAWAYVFYLRNVL